MEVPLNPTQKNVPAKVQTHVHVVLTVLVEHLNQLLSALVKGRRLVGVEWSVSVGRRRLDEDEEVGGGIVMVGKWEWGGDKSSEI